MLSTKKTFLKKRNHEKVIDIVEDIFSFNENKKGKGLKIVTPSQIIYLKERKSLRDKFLKISKIFDKFAKLNPSEKSTGSQFTKLNPRENASFFRISKFLHSVFYKLTMVMSKIFYRISNNGELSLISE